MAALLAEGGAAVLGVRYGTAEPRFVVERETGGLQIRRYGPRVAAETTVAQDEAASRNVGFRRLAGYIFGGNHESVKIAMTAPVTQASSDARSGQKIAMTAPVAQTVAADDAWMIRFFMPADYSVETLPAPNDPAVKLVAVPAETVAVLRFTGDRGPEAVASRTVDLLDALQDTALEPAGPPVAWFYDPPWTIPALRRNEIAVPVRER
ncbi:MAG: heme-binding protein [Mycobacterium sp.]